MKRGGGHSKRLRKSFEASIRQGYGVGLYRRDAFPTVSTLYVDETRFTTWPSFSAERGSASLGFSDFNLYFIPSLWIFTRMPPIYGAELLCEYDSSRFIKNHWMNGFLVMDERVEMFYRSSIEGNRKWMAVFFIFAELLSFFFFLICDFLFLLKGISIIYVCIKRKLLWFLKIILKFYPNEIYYYLSKIFISFFFLLCTHKILFVLLLVSAYFLNSKIIS